MPARLLLCSVLVLGSSLCFAQSRRTIESKTLSVPPVIDGVVDPAEWAGAASASGFVNNLTGQPAPCDTQVWLASDKKGIYIAFKAADPDPSKIAARSIQDGSSFDGEDRFVIFIDPMGRYVDGGSSRFVVNALGASTEDIAGGRSSKREWRGEWTKKARITKEGWEGEIMIPWKILPIPSPGIKNVQINFRRFQFSTNVLSFWSNVGPRWLVENDGQWKGVEIPSLPIEVKLQGYLTGESDEKADPRTSFRAGLDARIKFTPTLQGLASLNPDFKNIERDIAGIELTRSERFLDDPRPFFTEGSGFFDMFGSFTFGRLFYSNRIDDFDQGIKLFGSLDAKNSIGVLAAREDGRRTDSAFKFDHSLGTRSGVSAFGTTRQEPGFHNTALGATLYHGFGMWGVSADVAGVKEGGSSWQNASAVALDYNPPNAFGIIRFMRVPQQFDPALGYVPYTDRNGGYFYGEHWREWQKGPFKGASMDMGADFFQREDGSNRFRYVSAGGGFTTRSDIRFRAGFSTGMFGDEVEGSGGISVTLNPSNSHRSLSLSSDWGHRGGKRTLFQSASLSLRLAKGVDFRIQRSQLEFEGTSHQTIGTLAWEMDRHRSLSARWIAQDSQNGWHLSYRNAGGKGLEWYAIVGDPNEPTFRKRLALKVVWAS